MKGSRFVYFLFQIISLIYWAAIADWKTKIFDSYQRGLGRHFEFRFFFSCTRQFRQLHQYAFLRPVFRNINKSNHGKGREKKRHKCENRVIKLVRKSTIRSHKKSTWINAIEIPENFIIPQTTLHYYVKLPLHKFYNYVRVDYARHRRGLFGKGNYILLFASFLKIRRVGKVWISLYIFYLPQIFRRLSFKQMVKLKRTINVSRSVLFTPWWLNKRDLTRCYNPIIESLSRPFYNERDIRSLITQFSYWHFRGILM